MSEKFDFFKPTTEPALTIYNAFLIEAMNRVNKSTEAWIVSERLAVFGAAVECAGKYGLRVPTIEDVEKAENYALGSADYAAKWATRLVEIMRNKQ